MEIISKNNEKFNEFEEKTYKELMKEGIKRTQEWFRKIDEILLKSRNKQLLKPKDFKKTTVKCRFGYVEYYRRRYEITINGKKRYVYLLDEYLQIASIGQYSQSIVDMVMREVVEKSYRQTVKTISEDTAITMGHTSARNIVIKVAEKIKNMEQEKAKLYDRGELEGTKEKEIIFCEHDGIYFYLQDRKNNKEKRGERLKKEAKIGIIHEGKATRYTNDKKLINKQVVATIGTAKEFKKLMDVEIGTKYNESKIKRIIVNGDGSDWTHSIVEGPKEIFQLDMAHIQKKIYDTVKDEEYLKLMQGIVYTNKPEQILNIIYNYKVELEYDKKEEELNKVKELEKYLKNNIEGLMRYQYKLGFSIEELNKMIDKYPTLGTEESQMYCCCRKRMKRNRTSWSELGAEAMLKVISYVKSNTIEDIITGKMKEKINEELAKRVPEPKKIKKIKYEEMRYVATNRIIENVEGWKKLRIKSLLRAKKCSELMLIGL